MRIEKANAKINTYLNVVSRRADGYHNIVSIMQTVSLCDTVSVDFEDADETRIELSVSGNNAVPTDAKNLAWRAADAFLSKIGRTGRVRIQIEKNIPMEAGLAGGSADAAAVLRALYALCEHSITLDELCALGARLGADVPFCIRGGCFLVKGIGEKLTRVPSMPNGYIVIARMGEGVSTPAAYGALDRIYGDFSSVADDARFAQILKDWERGELLESAKSFFNLFEDVVAEQRPRVSEIKEQMMKAGAVRAMMSGSGPSVFGIFSAEADAQKACESLQDLGAMAFVCTPSEGYFDF